MSRYSIALLLSWIILLSLGLNIPQKMEGMIYPVVTSFELTKVTKISDGVKIWGSFDKNRSCSFEKIYGVLEENGIKSTVDVDFMDNRRTRQIGEQIFGPWKIELTGNEIKNVKIYTVHECHPLYDTITLIENPF